MSTTFGALLKQVRKRVGMTQADLAAATGYSRALIGAVERNQRLPDVEVVIQNYLPALALQEEPHLAAQLVELAARARGQRPPPTLPLPEARPSQLIKEKPDTAHRLPSLPTKLLGRDEEIDHLCNRLLGHQGRLLTLVGPPGVGKTMLALAVSATLQKTYKDGVCFVPLAAVSDPALVAATLVTALQVQEDVTKPPQTRLVTHLRHKELLLVLDNFEQLLYPLRSGEGQGVRLLAELLAECSRLRLLVTSRERLHLRAEQRFKVPSLTLTTAVELFVQRAQAVEAAFRLTPHNRPTVEAICQRLDCLPLALELCAAQIDLFSPVQLLTQLQERRLDLLVDGALDFPLQHRTLRTAIQRSYALLTAEEQVLFRTLGVFVGGFALPEVAAVMAGRLETDDWRLNDNPTPQSLIANLHSLIGKSLVRAETMPSGEQRFFLLETIREFALEQGRFHGEEALLRQQHYAAYLQLFRNGDSHLRGPEASAWFTRLTPEQDNLRAALHWALGEAHYADVVWLLIAVFWFWFILGHWYEQGHWIAQLLPYRALLDPDLRLALLINLYFVERAFEAFVPVERWEDEVRQLFALCSHPLLPATALHCIAGASHTNMPKAAAAWEQSIALARAAAELPPLSTTFGILADREFRLGHSLYAYADRLVEFGQFTQIGSMLDESFAIFQTRGSRYELSNCLGVLGRMALLQGRITQAHHLLSEAVALATEFNYHEMLGWLQGFLGLATFYQGEIAEAQRILQANHRLCMAMKAKGLVARNAIYLAETYLGEGLIAETAQCLQQGAAFFADLGWIRVLQVEHLLVAARLAVAEQQPVRAANLFGLVEQICRRLNYAVTGPRRMAMDAALATVRTVLEPRVFAEAFAVGQHMELAEALPSLLAPSSIGFQTR